MDGRVKVLQVRRVALLKEKVWYGRCGGNGSRLVGKEGYGIAGMERMGGYRSGTHWFIGGVKDGYD